MKVWTKIEGRLSYNNGFPHSAWRRYGWKLKDVSPIISVFSSQWRLNDATFEDVSAIIITFELHARNEKTDGFFTRATRAQHTYCNSLNAYWRWPRNWVQRQYTSYRFNALCIDFNIFYVEFKTWYIDFNTVYIDFKIHFIISKLTSCYSNHIKASSFIHV